MIKSSKLLLISDFKKRTEPYPAIKQVDVYQVFCHLLGFDPQPHNGTWASVRDFLKNSANSKTRTLKQALATILGSLALQMFHFLLLSYTIF